eukprot:8202932-Alexandrium_andersonii.AAC.1
MIRSCGTTLGTCTISSRMWHVDVCNLLDLHLVVTVVVQEHGRPPPGSSARAPPPTPPRSAGCCAPGGRSWGRARSPRAHVAHGCRRPARPPLGGD